MVEGGHLQHPVDPPTGVFPLGQGGIQILAKDVVDVPVFMQLVFQQSSRTCGFFEPSRMKSSSSSRAPRGGRFAGSLTLR